MSDTTSYAAEELGGRFGRHVTIYAVGTLGVAAVGAATVATQTRLVDPSQVGRLGVLLTLAGGLIVLYDLGILQGTVRAFMGATGSQSLSAAERSHPAAGLEQREAMTTGVAMSVVFAALGTLVIAVFRRPLAEFLLHRPSDADLVLLAAGLGAVGSVLRLAINVTRYERRPAIYAAMSVARPGFALIGSLVFLVTVSPTVHSILVGMLCGTAAALLLTFTLTRRLYRPLVSRAAARAVWKLGHRWIPDMIALWTLNATDVFVLSRYASDHTSASTGPPPRSPCCWRISRRSCSSHGAR